MTKLKRARAESGSFAVLALASLGYKRLRMTMFIGEIRAAKK